MLSSACLPVNEQRGSFQQWSFARVFRTANDHAGDLFSNHVILVRHKTLPDYPLPRLLLPHSELYIRDSSRIIIPPQMVRSITYSLAKTYFANSHGSSNLERRFRKVLYNSRGTFAVWPQCVHRSTPKRLHSVTKWYQGMQIGCFKAWIWGKTTDDYFFSCALITFFCLTRKLTLFSGPACLPWYRVHERST